MQKASRAAEERARLEGEGRGEMHCKAGAVTLKFGCVRDEETRETAVIRLAGRQRAGLGQTQAHLGRDVVGVCGVTENVNDGANRYWRRSSDCHRGRRTRRRANIVAAIRSPGYF